MVIRRFILILVGVLPFQAMATQPFRINGEKDLSFIIKAKVQIFSRSDPENVLAIVQHGIGEPHRILNLICDQSYCEIGDGQLRRYFDMIGQGVVIRYAQK